MMALDTGLATGVIARTPDRPLAGAFLRAESFHSQENGVRPRNVEFTLLDADSAGFELNRPSLNSMSHPAIAQTLRSPRGF